MFLGKIRNQLDIYSYFIWILFALELMSLYKTVEHCFFINLET